MEETLFEKLKRSLYLAKDTVNHFPELPKDIKRSYFYVLHPLYFTQEPLRVTDIADIMVVASSNITALVNEMEKKGLVLRQPSPNDRRASHLLITKYGEDILERYYLRFVDELTQAVNVNFNEKDIETTINTLTKWHEQVHHITQKVNDINSQNY